MIFLNDSVDDKKQSFLKMPLLGTKWSEIMYREFSDQLL